jgi:PAS domain S-box-containing protein
MSPPFALTPVGHGAYSLFEPGAPVTVAATIEAIATTQRRDAARLITLVLTVLGIAVFGPAWLLGATVPVLVAVMVTNVGYAVSYFIVRKGSVTSGMFIAVTSILAQHIALAAGNRELEPAPYLASIPILIVAATLSSQWLWVVFGLTALALGVEGSVRPLNRMDEVALLAGSVLMVVAFVVSLLHVRSTERAFAVAAERDSERARAALAARESEERYRLIADNTDDLFGLLDAQGRPIYMSPSHARLFGRSIEELTRLSLAELVAPESLDEVTRAFAKALATGDAKTEVSLSCPSGIVRVFDTRMTRVESKAGPLVSMTSRDITERRLFEQRLIAAERLESLGRLAGSVAHDFNNLLMVIVGASELARSAVKDRTDVTDDLDSVLEAARTASNLTRQLLTFSRKQVVAATELDFAEALGKIRELLERLVGKKVQLVFEFEPACPKVKIAAAHLEQLAMNLSINARDAMPNGGQLRFGLRPCSIDADAFSPLPAGTYVELTAVDQGHGIPGEILPYVFEPLFTTKGSAGTGLGLATCHSIATQWHGTISVDSEPGHGATFRVLFPASASTQQASARPSPVPGSVRRVLVVDGDAGSRETAARLLRSSGFEVVAASNLRDARRHIEDSSQPLDALLTDVILNGEPGIDLLEICRAQRPAARIVVMSGYAPNPSVNEKVVAASAKILAKPFNREEMLQALRGEPKV